MDCIFCKLAGGEIPTATLYEDDDFRVILDQGPATKGHALILPKKHYANIYELPEEVAARAMVLAKKMAGVMTEALKCDGFNLVQNNGEAAGQRRIGVGQHLHRLRPVLFHQGLQGLLHLWPLHLGQNPPDSAAGLPLSFCLKQLQQEGEVAGVVP